MCNILILMSRTLNSIFIILIQLKFDLNLI